MSKDSSNINASKKDNLDQVVSQLRSQNRSIKKLLDRLISNDNKNDPEKNLNRTKNE